MKFSILIPCYNAEPYIYELLDTLSPQIQEGVEVILIDDGSKKAVKSDYPWLKIIRQKNQGIAKTRNKLLEMSKGEAIGFIDADDLVSANYVDFVLNALETKEWDYIDLSWKSLEQNVFDFKLKNDSDSLINPSASTRIFKRSFIGNHRFNEKKDAAEDEDFTRHLGIKDAKHICATEYMYYYRTSVPGSNCKKFIEGETETKRIVYYFKEITKNMTYLVDEVKKLDEQHEIIIMTHNNELPELEKYAQFMRVQPIRAYEARGERTNLINVMPKVLKTQVVVYISQLFSIGGIETFMYSFCKQMSKHYDITVLYESIPTEQLVRLSKIVRTVKNDLNNPVACDSLIMVRIIDDKPRNVTYKQCIRMTHCIKQQPQWIIKKDCDHVVNVSQASKDSFGEEAEGSTVIHNLTDGAKVDRALILVSALRVGANDKQGNDARCVKFAKMLDDANIKYLWLYFGDKPMKNEVENMIYCGMRIDIRPFVKSADYLVQLSGSEAFSYSLLEALEVQTPVLVTPLEQNKDMGIVDGENGYIVPFEVDGFDVTKILNVPKFTYKHDNGAIIKQWRSLLGNTKPKDDYKPESELLVRVVRQYWDIRLDKALDPKTQLTMPYSRALELKDKGFVEVIG